MSSPRSSALLRNGVSRRPLLSLLAAAVLATTALASAVPAQAAPTPVTGAVGAPPVSYAVTGAGFGHGYGMSQYGAYGAARHGLGWRQILAFYYPRTDLTVMAPTTRIKVWITGDGDNSLQVKPAAGLTVRDSSGHSEVLPTGAGFTSWRVTRSGTGYRLVYRDAQGSWKTRTTALGTSTWSFADAASIVKVVMPGGSVREYRGTVALVKRGTGGRTVNSVRLEDYVRAVVPAEMPTSWAAEAVRVQAVAARSYAVRLRDFTSYAGYDLCDTTSCQVYPGYARTVNGRRFVLENSGGNAAATATASTIVTYRGVVALTQFASSNGGHTAVGGYPYLAAHADPYDGVVTSQRWTRTVTAASLGRVWPSVGAVTALTVTSRDGQGAWGGRVQTIRITGTKGSVSVRGTTFQYTYGLRSNLFAVTTT
ncbi:MAG: hypothetical protein JWP61_2399 [Friedmanniella sp.]|nr:hypothetical protein [Friedmanniella sp.]